MKHSMQIHLLGIGGTGMASLAGMLQALGHQVTGSDAGVYPPMSDLLAEMKIPVTCPYDGANIPHGIDLVIIGNVISRENPEAVAVLEKGIEYLSMPEAIRRFLLEGKTSLVVTGTHGKTTTTSLLAWVLEAAGKNPGFFVGGKPLNFPNNFQIGSGEYFVLEGDEYDTAFFDKGPKFLHYQAKHVILTSVEFDHADIYKNLEEILVSFRKLLDQIPSDGSLIANLDSLEVAKLLKNFSKETQTYSLTNSQADYLGKVKSAAGEMVFEVISPSKGNFEVSWNLPGRHNLGNALSVIALCLKLGLSLEEIQKGLRTFRGVKRRQEILGNPGGITVIDDFAHHPTAVKETILAIKEKYPQQRLWAVFEPRSNSSKSDVFQQDYAKSFEDADQVIIADVFHPEKVKSGKVLDVEKLAEDIHQRTKIPAKHVSFVDSICQLIKKDGKPGDVVLLMSNGDFQGLGKMLMENLKERNFLKS